MRRSEWIIGGILGLVVVGVLVALLAYWLNSRPEDPDDINNIENSTAFEAFDLAQPVAQQWSSDARLLTARASWQPQVDFRDGRSSWSMIFYSAAESATAVISVADGKAQMIRTRTQTENIQPGDLSNWQVDSPAAVTNILQQGGDDFMTLHAKVNLILTLDTQGSPTWRSTFLDTDSKQTFNLNITADTGEFTTTP
jgi:hypothetical protein